MEAGQWLSLTLLPYLGENLPKDPLSLFMVEIVYPQKTEVPLNMNLFGNMVTQI